MILLPLARPAYLKSFSIAMGFLSGLLMTALSYWLDLGALFPLVAVLAIGFPLFGLLWPTTMSLPYRLWNTAANYFARLARVYLIGICFYIILLTVGRARTSMKLSRPKLDESLWRAKKTLSPDTYPYEFAANGKYFTEKGWVRSYLCWARASGQIWALCLVPLLAMLSAVEIYRDRRFPAGVYTLF
jgi:hypothetical protein